MLKLLYVFTRGLTHNGKPYLEGQSEYFHDKARDAFLAVHGFDSLDGPYAGEEVLAGGKGSQFMDKNKSLSSGKIEPWNKATTTGKPAPDPIPLTEEEREAADKAEAEAIAKRDADENAEAELRIQAIVDERVEAAAVEVKAKADAELEADKVAAKELEAEEAAKKTAALESEKVAKKTGK